MIEVYEQVFPRRMCKELIDTIDNSSEVQSLDKFDQIELNPGSEQSKVIFDVINRVAEIYMNKYDPKGISFPEKYMLEAVRVKRYAPNEQCFPMHTDVTDKTNCTRFLSFLVYLNYSEAGTAFDINGSKEFTIEAKESRVVVFPPMWPFPHEGIMPTKEPKYVMSTYLHYV